MYVEIISTYMRTTHGIAILYHLHQRKTCTSRDIRATVGIVGINLVVPCDDTLHKLRSCQPRVTVT